jgi:hypothetical protein
MSRQRKQIAIIAGSVAALVWGALFLSNSAVLVWGSGPGGDAKVGTLRCHYFTGTGFTERKFLYTETGVLGRETCPRWIDLQGS